MSNPPDESELAIRVMATPADTNASGDIFGGWLMSQMDVAGGLVAGARAQGRVATVAVDAMTFHRPVHVGDVLCCYAEIVRVGTTSMSIRVDTWVLRRRHANTRVKVTEGVFTYVALDEDGAKRRLTIYVRRARDEKNVAFRIAEARGVSAFYWVEKPYAYALIGKIDRRYGRK